MEAAIGLEKRANVATRGWFRIDPGQCKQVLDGALDADMVYVHARTPPVYGSAPLPQNGNADFCVRDGNFEIANARSCPVSQQARFSRGAAIRIRRKGPAINLAEEADYDDAQARLAGIQRLLVIAGYDANPIDGVQGAKTQAALNEIPERPQAAGGRSIGPGILRDAARCRAQSAKAPASPGATTPNIP